MTGKVCMITGANSGIGKAIATGLAETGASIVMVCRNAGRGESAMAEIRSKTGNSSVDLMLVDLSSQDSILKFVEDFKQRYNRLHILLNNAGVFITKRTVTVDRIESTFAVNYLAPFLLTNLLLDTLKASTPSRIINISSATHHNAKMDFDDLQTEKRFNGLRVYAKSKLAVTIFTYELARRLEGTGVTANCFHPGAVRTNLGGSNRSPLGLAFRFAKLFFSSPEKGAETAIYLASSPEVDGISGKYFEKKAPVRSSDESNDTSLARKLWDVSARLTHLSS